MFILGCLFGVLALLAIGLQRTYSHIPAKEVKRRAAAGDPLSQLLYRAVSYGVSLRVLLWALIGVCSAASFVLFSETLDRFWAFLIVLFLIWLGFIWLPSSRLTRVSERLVIWLTPPLAWVLRYIHGPVERFAMFIRKRRPVHFHSGLYEKEDLADLLEQQRHQPDNRIRIGEIDLLQHALRFGDKLVLDAMVPRRSVSLVSADDLIGPKLMAELYQSGHSRFPVFEGAFENVVGTLYIRDLVDIKEGGKIAKAMRPDVFYVHEDFTLFQALQAFIKTKHHLFVVVNSFEEFVGIITIEDIVEQVIGKHIVDEFDQYEDLRAVAAAAAKQDHLASKHAHPVESDVAVPESSDN